MSFEIISDAFLNLKSLIVNLTGKVVLEENDNSQNKEGFYVSSSGLNIKNSAALSDREEKITIYETFQISYTGISSYNELKKLYILLNSSIGNSSMKACGFGYMNSTMSGQSVMNVDGGFFETPAIQLGIHYDSKLTYEENQLEYIFNYQIIDKKLNQENTGEVDDTV